MIWLAKEPQLASSNIGGVTEISYYFGYGSVDVFGVTKNYTQFRMHGLLVRCIDTS